MRCFHVESGMTRCMLVSVLAPGARAFTASADVVSFVSSDGPISILRDHQECMCPVLPGPICFDGKLIATFKGKAGFMHVVNNEIVMILSEMLELDQLAQRSNVD